MFGRLIGIQSWSFVLFCIVFVVKVYVQTTALYTKYQFGVQDSSMNICPLSPGKPLTNIWSPLASAFLLHEGRSCGGGGRWVVIGCLLSGSFSTLCSQRRSLPESLMRLAIQWAPTNLLSPPFQSCVYQHIPLHPVFDVGSGEASSRVCVCRECTLSTVLSSPAQSQPISKRKIFTRWKFSEMLISLYSERLVEFEAIAWDTHEKSLSA